MSNVSPQLFIVHAMHETKSRFPAAIFMKIVWRNVYKEGNIKKLIANAQNTFFFFFFFKKKKPLQKQNISLIPKNGSF